MFRCHHHHSPPHRHRLVYLCLFSLHALHGLSCCRYLMYTLDKFVEEDYSLVYFHYGLTNENKPPLSWLWQAYRAFDRKYKKNLKALYLVHPTNFIRVIWQIFTPAIRCVIANHSLTLPYHILVLIFRLFYIFTCKSSSSDKHFTTVMDFPKPPLSSVELQSVCHCIGLVYIRCGTVFYIYVRYNITVLYKTIHFFISLHINVHSPYFKLHLSFILIFQCKIWPEGEIRQLPS